MRAGIIILPMAITVAGEEPEMAAKNIHAITDAIARPPVNLPTKSFITLTNLPEIAPSAMILPARIKNGTPRRTKLSSPLKSCWIRDVKGVWAIKIRYIAVVAARTREIGILRVSRAKKQKRMIVKFICYFLLTFSKGSPFKKLLKCLKDNTKNLKAIDMENSGIAI
jgi:hypothetical protein